MNRFDIKIYLVLFQVENYRKAIGQRTDEYMSLSNSTLPRVSMRPRKF